MIILGLSCLAAGNQQVTPNNIKGVSVGEGLWRSGRARGSDSPMMSTLQQVPQVFPQHTENGTV